VDDPLSTQALDDLLAKLGSGNAAAVEQAFLAYEPYLRMLVRRQLPARLRPKFDSLDIVQSVWVDLLHGFREADWRFASAAQLRAFLVRLTQNRFIDRLRHHRAELEHQRPLAAAEAQGLTRPCEPEPSEVAQAEELWEEILALCSPTHQEVVRLKRQGFAVADIAARVGLHPSSVRRILYELANRLASRRKGPPPTPSGDS
jgi:RNA polymerase sigma-70 factor (ECF subfamily)